MRAARYASYGLPANVVSVQNVAVPAVGKRQVLVRVAATSVNNVDAKRVGGYLRIMDGPLPTTPCLDFSGVVTELGPGCTSRLSVGDAVYGVADVGGDGAMAEYMAVSEKCCAHKPANVSFADAACLPTAVGTAYAAMHEAGGVSAGQRVLVLGGSSGCGSVAVQLAAAAGASVVAATCSPANHERVQQLGATHLFDYRERDFPAAVDAEGLKFDLICDAVGGTANWAAAKRLVADGGRIVRIAEDDVTAPRITPGFICRLVGRKLRRSLAGWLRLGPRYSLVVNMDRGYGLQDLTRSLLESGKVAAVRDSEFTLQEAVPALERSLAGHVCGKILVVVDPVLAHTTSQ